MKQQIDDNKKLGVTGKLGISLIFGAVAASVTAVLQPILHGEAPTPEALASLCTSIGTVLLVADYIRER